QFPRPSSEHERAGGRALRPSSTPSLLRRLPGLAPHVLALVPDAFALVRIRRPVRADVGGDLSDELLVGAADDGPRRSFDGDRDRAPSNPAHVSITTRNRALRRRFGPSGLACPSSGLARSR